MAQMVHYMLHILYHKKTRPNEKKNKNNQPIQTKQANHKTLLPSLLLSPSCGAQLPWQAFLTLLGHAAGVGL